MTQTITLWPIIKALFQATLFISNNNIPNNWNTQWQAANESHTHQIQQQFIQKYLAQHNDLAKFKPDELKAWASKDYQELNAILAKEHFAIQLQPFPKNGFGVVSILDVMMEWQSPGTSQEITKDKKTYAGAEIKRGFNVFTSDTHTHPIARIETKSGDTAWLTIADKPRKDFDLLQHIETIKKNLHPDNGYQKVIFPKIDLDQQPDITWLLRMSYGDYFIAQALQQTKLKMNEFGAHVQSAVAIALAESSMMPVTQKILIIDQPFFCWIEKPGVSIPVFAGYLDVDVWKDPGSLDMTSDHKKTEVPPMQSASSSWWIQIKMVVNEWWSKIIHLFD